MSEGAKCTVFAVCEKILRCDFFTLAIILVHFSRKLNYKVIIP